MVKKIVKGKQIFARKAQPATKADKQVVTDLMDTLRENRGICVGMAANMIGVNKRIIAVNMGFANIAMLNPVIVSKKELQSLSNLHLDQYQRNIGECCYQ